ncbi:MAG: nucleotidyltransferase domain-containing protein [Candidatus Omnitrophica bacterium]|nr:nucleotidyltransferase domain-containing protein [Candidatus Omnitrophota bacterium]
MLKRARKVERIMERFKQELKKLGVNPGKVILYGSCAKGNPREDSDIDLIVVSDDFEGMNLRERLELLGLAAGRIFEPVEALGYTEKEIKQCQETFLETVLNSTPVSINLYSEKERRKKGSAGNS